MAKGLLDLLCEGLLYAFMYSVGSCYLQPKAIFCGDINLTAGSVSFLEIMGLAHAFAIKATLIYATGVFLSSLSSVMKLIDFRWESDMLQSF